VGLRYTVADTADADCAIAGPADVTRKANTATIRKNTHLLADMITPARAW